LKLFFEAENGDENFDKLVKKEYLISSTGNNFKRMCWLSKNNIKRLILESQADKHIQNSFE
jgi:hypothetical protein